jgi:hypothetical protein
MEGSLLSRVCGTALIRVIQSTAANGWDAECFRMRLVRGVSGDGQRSDISHVVLAWEGTAGDRAAARLCLCGQVANPDYR